MLTRCLPLLLLPSLALAEVQLNAERDSGPAGTAFELVIEATQSRPISSLDLAPVKNQFEILSQRHSSRSSFQGGQSLYTHRWNLQLKPRTTGTLTIPPLVVGYERSPLFRYQATPGAQKPALSTPSKNSVRLSVELLETLVYSRTPNQLRVRLHYAVPLSHAELTEPSVEGLHIEALGEPHHGQETVDGQAYRTIEQHYLLLAEHAGTFEIPPIEFEGVAPSGSAEGLRLKTEPLSLEVLPPPAESVEPWLAATELRLSQQWAQPPQNLRAGDTLNRTITIEAHGIPASWLPVPSLEAPEGVRVFPQPVRRTQDTRNGTLVSRLEMDIGLLFTRPGPVTLPSLALDWWDSVRERPERSELAATNLVIEGFVDTESESAPSEARPAAPSEAAAGSFVGGQWSAWLWALIGLICAAGWSLSRSKLRQTEALLAQAREELQTQRQANAQADYREEEAHAFNALAHACRQNDPEGATRALIQWAKYSWPEQAIGSFSDLEINAQDPTLSYLLRNLEHSLSGVDDDPWMGDLLLSQVDRLRRRRRR
ncbi:BatD family protein [Motiliproteus sp. SC1-56]|uniref:BatD family protein n=1 Tax=Motiliproteus sp. SC1-56 TaxID=2799565 RepID=UPI001A8F49AF|nr:BatD family protein [Motiliproteus sp. SC1-56]